MPLSEFLRKAGRKLDSNQQKPQQKPPYTDLSSRFENELVELVWENGQVVMQGQSSRVNDLPSNTARARDAGAGQLTSTSARFGKFVVPSGDMDLSQDDEIVPWLSYSIDDDLEILPEISGVAANGMSGSCKQTGSNIQSGANNPSKASSFSSKDLLFGSWLPQHRQASDALGSIVTDSSSKHLDAVFRNPVQRRDAASMSTNGSSFLNFSHFSRPATLVKASLPKPDGIPNSVVERIETKEKGSAANSSNPVKSIRVEQFSSMPEDIDSHGTGGLARVSSREPVVKAAQGSCPRERSEKLRRESSIKNDKPPNPSSNESSAKEVERTIEPMVASSSVGSGNSVDRVSCERTQHSKRKCRDIEESDYRSDDVETESVDGKKATHVRGSKRSRAAEVHNLSERRRRDRINEKMRALQELIPNCNKADKASMLDEAIEYLKTLQLRVQIMSMGSGFYMPPMMFPTGMQHMHPAHLPHYQPMGFGMGMADMNGDSSPYPNFPVPPLQAPHFPSPMSGLASFQRMPGQNLPVYGPPGQAPPNPAPKAAYVPLAPRPSLAMGSSGLRNGSSSGIPSTSQVMTTVSSQSMCTVEASSSLNNKPSQLQPRNEVRDQTAAAQDNKQTTGGAGVSFSSATATADINKEPGCD